MKLIDFLNIINKLSPLDKDVLDLEIVVQTANKELPHNHMSPVKDVQCGSGWTRGLFILSCSDDLVVEKLATSESIAEMAKDKLDYLKENYKKIGLPYQAQTRDQAWISGFCVGVEERLKMNNMKEKK